MIATRLRMLPGNIFESTGDTLQVEARQAVAGKKVITIHRADGTTFEAIPFWAGVLQYERCEYDPDIGGTRFYGVTSLPGWYVIDPDMTQPAPVAVPSPGLDPDAGRGLFVPKLSAVADSFRRLFGGDR